MYLQVWGNGRGIRNLLVRFDVGSTEGNESFPIRGEKASLVQDKKSGLEP